MTVQSGSGTKWWFNGLPFQTVAQSNQSGSLKYWFSGQPMSPYTSGGAPALPKVLNAEPGALLLTGNDAELHYLHALQMLAETGVLTLTGGDAGLIYREQARMQAATGVLSLTGCDVTLPITRRPPVIVQENLKFGRSVYVSRW